MEPLTVRSFAKINWMLRILGRRPDGYHDLETIFQTISLHDVLTFSRSDRLELACDDPTIPLGEVNLAWQAAARMIEEFGIDPVRIDIRKAIPAGGGLGGGSSNAATALMALDRIFELDAGPERLLDIALELGSDVPFFLVGGTAWGSGRGERLRLLPSPSPVPLMLLLPEERVGTADAYAALAEARANGDVRVPRPFRFDLAEWVMREGVVDRGSELVNDFEAIVFRMHPRLRDLKEAMLDAGAALTLMSGSGSAIFGAFRDRESRDRAVPRFVRGLTAVPCETISAHEAMRDLR